MSDKTTTGTFGDHLEALRPHLLRSAAVFVAIFAAAFLFRGLLVDGLLFGPLNPQFPTNRMLAWLASAVGSDVPADSGIQLTLVSTTLAGQFNLHMKIAFFAALVASFPYMVWELWRFVRPALTEREAHACRSMTGWVSACFLTGAAFGYVVLVPFTVRFLANYNVSDAVGNMVDANSYLATVVNITLVCGLVFQLPLLVWFLARAGFIGSAFMCRYRRHAMFALAVLSAVVTPPDIVSMILIIIPLCALYELSVHIARRVESAAGRQ